MQVREGCTKEEQTKEGGRKGEGRRKRVGRYEGDVLDRRKGSIQEI